MTLSQTSGKSCVFTWVHPCRSIHASAIRFGKQLAVRPPPMGWLFLFASLVFSLGCALKKKHQAILCSQHSSEKFSLSLSGLSARTRLFFGFRHAPHVSLLPRQARIVLAHAKAWPDDCTAADGRTTPIHPWIQRGPIDRPLSLRHVHHPPSVTSVSEMA